MHVRDAARALLDGFTSKATAIEARDIACMLSAWCRRPCSGTLRQQFKVEGSDEGRAGEPREALRKIVATDPPARLR